MIQVEQTELADYTVEPPIRGNCLAACVASIFEVPIQTLEGVYDSNTLWAWLREYFPAIGVLAHTYYLSSARGELSGVPLGARYPSGHTNMPGVTPWIAVVRSLRTPHAHCVVMVCHTLAWDPHPHREMGVGEQIGDYTFTLDHPEKLPRIL